MSARFSISAKQDVQSDHSADSLLLLLGRIKQGFRCWCGEVGMGAQVGTRSSAGNEGTLQVEVNDHFEVKLENNDGHGSGLYKIKQKGSIVFWGLYT